MPEATRVLISGYYGYANPGDEAILAVLCAQLRQRLPGVSIAVISGQPEQTAATHGVEAVLWSDPDAIAAAVRQSDLVVTGGGGIFHDYGGVSKQGLFSEGNYGVAFHVTAGLLAGIYGKPLAIYGVGVGPLFSEDARALTRAVCESASAISVRDAASLALLEELGVTGAEMTADPGFLFEPGPIVATPERVVVVVRQWSHGVEQEQWERELAGGLDLFLERHGGEVVFVPFQQFPGEAEDDAAASRRVHGRMQRSQQARIWEGAPPVQEKAALIAGSRLTVAMRLHALVFALRERVPVVALTYDEKVRQVAGRVSCPGVDMPELTAARVVELMERAQAEGGRDASALVALASRNTDLALEALRRGPARLPLAMARRGLEALLAEQKKLRHWLSDQKTNYEYQVGVQQREISGLQGSLTDLEQRHEAEVRLRVETQEKLAGTESTLTQMEAARKTLEENLAGMTADRDSWRARAEQLGADKAQLEGEKAGLESELAAWKKLHTDTVRDWDAYSTELDQRLREYRPQRAWRAMLAIRKAYTMWTRQGLGGKLRLLPFAISALFGGGAVETEQLEFPQRPKPRKL